MREMDNNELPSNSHFEALDSYSSLLHSASEILVHLKSDHDAERVSYNFIFDRDLVPELETPLAVRGILPDFDSVSLQLTREVSSPYPMLSIHFRSEHGSLILARDGALSHTGDETPDLYIDEDAIPHKITKTNEGEINAFLMSAAAPREDGLYPTFEDTSLLQPHAFEAIRDALWRTSSERTSVRDHSFKSSEAFLTYLSVNDTPEDVTIQLIDQAARTIIIEDKVSTGLNFQFFTVEHAGELTKTPLHPTAEEVGRFSRILEKEAAHLSNTILVGSADFVINADPLDIAADNETKEAQRDNEIAVLSALDPDNIH